MNFRKLARIILFGDVVFPYRDEKKKMVRVFAFMRYHLG